MLDINTLGLSQLNQSKPFTVLNPFNSMQPLTDDKGKEVVFHIFSLTSPKVQNELLELKRNDDFESWKILTLIVDKFEGELGFDGKKVTQKNLGQFLKYLDENEDYRWLSNQLVTFASKGDFSGKIEKA
jgi:hypothetical protein